MSDTEQKTEIEPATAKPQADASSAPQAAPPAPRRTRWPFKLLGACLIVFATWMGYCSYLQGDYVDLTDPVQQEMMFVEADYAVGIVADTTAEVAVTVVSWAQRQLPASNKEKPHHASGEETKVAAQQPKRLAPRPQPAQPRPAPPPTRLDPLYEQARAQYQKGQEAYDKTDPMLPHDEVQRNLRVAEPCFLRCQELLEDARRRGLRGSEYDSLEERATKRLYDCRKRIELRIR